MGTLVKNPTYRAGQQPFKTCKDCGEKFTNLGLSRHWDHCKKKPPKVQNENSKS